MASGQKRTISDRLRATYGLRLFFEPRFQLLALSVLAVVAVGFRVIQFAALTAAPQFGYDVASYWHAGRHLLDGVPLYTPEQLAGPYPDTGNHIYIYPPLLAVLFMPFAAIFPTSYTPVAWIWAAIGVLLLIAVVRQVGISQRIVADRRGVLLLIAAAFAFPPTVGELVIGNIHIELLMLFALAWWGIGRGDERGTAVAGLAIGAAALLKIAPVLVVVWFLATGRWRAAMWSIVGMAGLAVLTLPIAGIEPWLAYPTVLLNLSRPAYVGDALAPAVWLGDLIGPAAARVAVLVVAVAAIAWSARRRVEPASYGVAIAAATLVAPGVFHHYLVMLLLPMMLALAVAPPTFWVVIAYLCMWGGTQPALGGAAWILNRALPTLGALLVPAGLLAWGRRRAQVKDLEVTG